MKLNKKSKGKVHPLSPSPSPSSSSSASSPNDEIAALKLLLPAAILTIITVLSLQEREVLAFMITHSIKTSANPAIILEENRRRLNKKTSLSAAKSAHKSPTFDCGCLDCYMSYWARWNSSPNHDLINQAIEAFEEHLEHSKNNNNVKGKKRQDEITIPELRVLERFLLAEEVRVSPDETVVESVPEEEAVEAEVAETVAAETESVRRAVGNGGGGSHKGLARKVLPDVIGVLNSRFWSLWRPN